MTDVPADVNERVTEEWKADTIPGERVRTGSKLDPSTARSSPAREYAVRQSD